MNNLTKWTPRNTIKYVFERCASTSSLGTCPNVHADCCVGDLSLLPPYNRTQELLLETDCMSNTKMCTMSTFIHSTNSHPNSATYCCGKYSDYHAVILVFTHSTNIAIYTLSYNVSRPDRGVRDYCSYLALPLKGGEDTQKRNTIIVFACLGQIVSHTAREDSQTK